MKATKPTNTKTVWQVRWTGRLGTRTFRTRKEARQVVKTFQFSEWQKPLIIKVTEQVVQ